MLKILIIRHGETFSNAEKRFSGHQDVDLTEKGIWQAEQLAERLAEFPIKAIYSSDLKRAIHTASIINKRHQLNLSTEPLFREICFGEWEGLRFEEINTENNKGNCPHWWHEPCQPLPGGESISDLQRRVLDGLEKIIDEHDHDEQYNTVAIVCHGGVARIIISIALDIPLEKIWYIKQYSTALNIIFYQKHNIYFVESINDISHLKGKEPVKLVEE
ncbi:MAG: histidine phosphatase family protein [Atribacterota bacterium]|jgi:alpha-ribazole phosphatase|nr:histidine phosphatase family protein [Atribacterota bacterium]MDD4895348.1 histidine phosphatase family protein [Atribacterota bacterium]MDD5637475.1 histidine phosphatase family protein [Atribacterota bacterium]